MLFQIKNKTISSYEKQMSSFNFCETELAGEFLYRAEKGAYIGRWDMGAVLSRLVYAGKTRTAKFELLEGKSVESRLEINRYDKVLEDLRYVGFGSLYSASALTSQNDKRTFSQSLFRRKDLSEAEFDEVFCSKQSLISLGENTKNWIFFQSKGRVCAIDRIDNGACFIFNSDFSSHKQIAVQVERNALGQLVRRIFKNLQDFSFSASPCAIGENEHLLLLKRRRVRHYSYFIFKVKFQVTASGCKIFFLDWVPTSAFNGDRLFICQFSKCSEAGQYIARGGVGDHRCVELTCEIQ